MMSGIGGFMGMMGGGLGPGSGFGPGGDQGYGPGSDQGYGPGSDRGYGPGMMGGSGYDRAGDNDDDVDAGWMIGLMILLIGLAAAGVFLVTRPRQRGSAPAELLAQRFAKGEIDADEYEQRRTLLGGSR
jgi:hypothetical protein